MIGRNFCLIVGIVIGGCCVASCSGTTGADAALPCLDDSQPCVDARMAALGAMQSDSKRSWISKPVNARLHASGVRMFAYRTLKDRLSCAELTTGMNEMSSVRATLAGPVPGVSKDRIVQAKMLADETHGELKKVHVKKGCA